ncbi:MAG: sodium/glutamate symporter [Peptococcaceae bacterium]|nr:sodium/glutamate symporter [Peptococcaceae bacterium]
MTLMVSISWIGVMLLVGVFLRSVLKPLANILVPACVTGGVVGFILMNTGILTKLGVDFNMLNMIVTNLFTITFISMGLTATPKEEGVSTGKETFKGSMALGMVWDILYGLQPLVGFGVLALIGGFFGMSANYGLQIPFAFCQGPGQSTTFGGLIEAGGLMPGAQQVGITFAVMGFVFAFLIGVPIAKYGMKHKLATFPREISPGIKKGVFEPHEQTQSTGMMTTYNGNIDTLAFNLALVGLGYVITHPLCQAIQLIPISLVQTIGSMEFFVGLFVGYAIKFVMDKTGVKKYHDDQLQARITGWGTDFMICAAFMAVQLAVVGKWMIPIMVTCVVVGLVTFAVSLFFCQHIGGAYDFERLLGMWGCATGTCPSGIALIRIVDPELRTTAAAEMGAMNAWMTPVTLLAPFCIEYCTGHMSLGSLFMWYVIAIVAATAVLFILRGFSRKKSFDLFKGERYLTLEDIQKQHAASEK